ncbi:MAG: hypothetical protein R2710_06990 [Acidimicrobiales bacterium]
MSPATRESSASRIEQGEEESSCCAAAGQRDESLDGPRIDGESEAGGRNPERCGRRGDSEIGGDGQLQAGPVMA